MALPMLALWLLVARPEIDVRWEDHGAHFGLVFGTAAGKLYKDWGGAIRRIRRAIGQASAGKEQRFTFHDVRRSFVSHLAGQFDLDLLDQCLGHTRKGVFGIYQRSARWPERVAALNRWSTLVVGEDQIDNVLQFRLER